MARPTWNGQTELAVYFDGQGARGSPPLATSLTVRGGEKRLTAATAYLTPGSDARDTVLLTGVLLLTGGEHKDGKAARYLRRRKLTQMFGPGAVIQEASPHK